MVYVNPLLRISQDHSPGAGYTVGGGGSFQAAWLTGAIHLQIQNSWTLASLRKTGGRLSRERASSPSLRASNRKLGPLTTISCIVVSFEMGLLEPSLASNSLWTLRGSSTPDPPASPPEL